MQLENAVTPSVAHTFYSFGYKTIFSSNYPKNLDLSYEIILEFWDYSERENPSYSRLNKTNLDIWLV